MGQSRNMRSEERRVGKEWRYRGGWSSDVCPSYLLAAQFAAQYDTRAFEHGVRRYGRHAAMIDGTIAQHEIGRASCRERVEISGWLEFRRLPFLSTGRSIRRPIRHARVRTRRPALWPSCSDDRWDNRAT